VTVSGLGIGDSGFVMMVIRWCPDSKSRIPQSQTTTPTGDPAGDGAYVVIVNVGAVNRVANCCNARVAGPWVTVPFVLYCEPWHGHT